MLYGRFHLRYHNGDGLRMSAVSKKTHKPKNFSKPTNEKCQKNKNVFPPLPAPYPPPAAPLISRDVTGVLRWGWTHNDPNGEKIPQMRFFMENPQMKKIRLKSAPFHFSRSKWGTQIRMNSKWPQWWEEPTNENYYGKPTNENCQKIKNVKIHPFHWSRGKRGSEMRMN